MLRRTLIAAVLVAMAGALFVWPETFWKSFGGRISGERERRIKTSPHWSGKVMLPVHWGTFNLAFHDWFEPPERLLAAASGIHLVIPRPGEMVDSSAPAPVERWWMVR